MSRSRLDQVNANIKRELGMIIHEESDEPSLLLSVTRVETAPDLKSAKVFISSLGSSADVRKLVQKLNKRRSFFQKELRKRIIMKFMPKILFVVDETWLRGRRIEEVIDNVQK